MPIRMKNALREESKIQICIFLDVLTALLIHSLKFISHFDYSGSRLWDIKLIFNFIGHCCL